MKEFEDYELDALEKEALVNEIRDLYRVLVSPCNGQSNNLSSQIKGQSEEKKLER